MKNIMWSVFFSIGTLSTACSQSVDSRVPEKASATVGKKFAADLYLGLRNETSRSAKRELNEAKENWELNHVPFVLEVLFFIKDPSLRKELIDLLEKKTKQNFNADIDKWRQWLWAQDYQPAPDYPAFKSALYRVIDRDFQPYFHKDHPNEVRWGGVQQDGIPPLHRPKMLAASKASYLGDQDVVFGIQVGDDARAYPKRILAWHEMFTDTIQGVPLAGVY